MNTTITEVGPRAARGGTWLRALRKAPLHVVLFILAVVWLIPSVGLLVTSFRHGNDIYSGGWWLAFGQLRFTLENYLHVLTARGTSGNLARNLINSFVITVPSTLIPVLFAVLAAYGFAWIRFRGSGWLFLVIVALLIVPQQMAFVPVLRMLNPLKLVGSFPGIWIIHSSFALPLAVFMFRNAFASIPRDLIEYSRIDGASELTIALRIVTPLSVPIIASYTIFQFLWVWNDLLVSLVFMQNASRQPLTVGISQMLSLGTMLQWDVLSAAAFITMAIPLAVFFCLQRYFVRGLVAGAVKG
jgi:alpha-glucoside transport system permease protein